MAQRQPTMMAALASLGSLLPGNVISHRASTSQSAPPQVKIAALEAGRRARAAKLARRAARNKAA